MGSMERSQNTEVSDADILLMEVPAQYDAYSHISAIEAAVPACAFNSPSMPRMRTLLLETETLHH
jgi:hypothetical protein